MKEKSDWRLEAVILRWTRGERTRRGGGCVWFGQTKNSRNKTSAGNARKLRKTRRRIEKKNGRDFKVRTLS